jgi:hypothetical protein
MPADLLRNAPAWRLAKDSYQRVLLRPVECEQMAKSGAQTFVLALG